MEAAGVKAKSNAGKSESPFASADEMRQVLDRLLEEVDGDETAGPKLRAAHTPHRFCFTDLDLVLDVAGANDGVHSIVWSFGEDVDWKPAMSLEMDSAVANRYLQGKLSIPVGLARGLVKIRCTRARAALNLLPANRELIAHYRDLIARDYPQLVIS
jgi:hypothetical protein